MEEQHMQYSQSHQKHGQTAMQVYSIRSDLFSMTHSALLNNHLGGVSSGKASTFQRALSAIV